MPVSQQNYSQSYAFLQTVFLSHLLFVQRNINELCQWCIPPPIIKPWLISAQQISQVFAARSSLLYQQFKLWRNDTSVNGALGQRLGADKLPNHCS